MEPTNMWYLENVDAQGIFCPQKLGTVGDTHAYKEFKKGDLIFEPNQSADKIYFINTGRVKIGTETQGERSITKAILEEGEIFGELAVVGELTRRDYAIALEPSRICEISKEELTNLFIDHHPLYLFVMNLVGSRALEMEKRLESLVFKDSRTRVIEFLMDLVVKKGQRVGYEWVVRKFITHQEIANLTATSRQTVTTTLNDLKNKNLLTFNRKRLLVRDLDSIKKELITIEK